MAIPQKNTAPVQNAEAAFDQEGGQEVFLDRPIVEWKRLGEQKMIVKGWLVCEEELNLPHGAERKDGRTTWDAFVIHLTAPTKAVKNGDIVDCKPGQEVYVAANPKNISIRSFLGKSDMHEIIILGTGEIPMKGRQAMQDYRVKATGKSEVRKGAFLIGGPGQQKVLKDGNLDSTLGAVDGANANASNGQTVAVP